MNRRERRALNRSKAGPPTPAPLKGAEQKQGLTELINFVGIALACGSWAWTVLAPQSSEIFGSLLLFATAGSLVLGLHRTWPLGKAQITMCALLIFTAAGLFDWQVVVKPQRGKPFEALLVEGYHLTNECGSIPGYTETPLWMRDQSKEWQSRVQQLIEQRLDAADAQTWQDAIVIGTVANENTNAYQCLWLSSKVAALEAIIAKEFKSDLKHRDEIGATYWIEAPNGEADLTDVFKSGDRSAHVFINGGKDHPTIKITGHNLPVRNGILAFQPEVLQ